MVATIHMQLENHLNLRRHTGVSMIASTANELLLSLILVLFTCYPTHRSQLSPLCSNCNLFPAKLLDRYIRMSRWLTGFIIFPVTVLDR